jgi:hypothetical protein
MVQNFYFPSLVALLCFHVLREYSHFITELPQGSPLDSPTMEGGVCCFLCSFPWFRLSCFDSVFLIVLPRGCTVAVAHYRLHVIIMY